MKKTILLFAIVFGSLSLSGQVSIGLTIGNNFCKVKQSGDNLSDPFITGTSDKDLLITNGFTIGIPLEISLSKRISLFTMFSYLQKGSKVEETIKSDDFVITSNGTNKFNYLEIPVQGKFYLVKKRMNAYLSIGPSFGYLINAKSKGEVTTLDIELGTTTDESFDEKIKSEDFNKAGINRVDISLSIGAGIGYKVGIGNLFFNVNYNHGFRDMIQDDSELGVSIDQYNRGLTTTIGYLIPLSK
jgi:hypothetical protein